MLQSKWDLEKQLFAELRCKISEQEDENLKLTQTLHKTQAASDAASKAVKAAEADKVTLKEANDRIVERLKQTQEENKVSKLEEALERLGQKLIQQEEDHKANVLIEICLTSIPCL